MTSITAALHGVRAAFEGLVAETQHLRSQLESIVQRGSMPAGATVLGGRAPTGMNGTPAKRGRKFKFTDAQAAGFRRRVESGEKATTLAKELKISLPTMYNTLKRAGWTGRRGRRAAGTAMPSRRRGAKRGRAFKFTDAQAAELKKQVDHGKSALALAQELKISLPTMYNTLKRAGWAGRGGRGAKVLSAKRGRPFRFTEQQAAGLRKRVESGEKVTSIAKEMKVSLPALYSTLRRAGWTGRKGRKAKAA